MRRFLSRFTKAVKVVIFLLGVIALVASLQVIFYGELPVYRSLVGTLEATLGNDYFLVGAIAAVGIFLALIFAYQGRAGTVQQIETPDAEGAQPVPAPGDDFDELVGRSKSWRAREERKEVRERLRETAVSAVTKKENCPRYAAEHRVETGSWTEDTYAAALLGDEEAPGLPLLTRLRFAVGGSSFGVSVERAVDEIERMMEEQDVQS